MNRFTANDTDYLSKEVKVRGNIFVICQAKGKFNYISVRKVTNNPFGGLGKQFENWDAAALHYSSPEMKVELLKAELEFHNC